MINELSLKIEEYPELVEKLGEFLTPTNLDSEAHPMKDVFYYTLLKSHPEDEKQRQYIVYAEPIHGNRTKFTIRQLYEGWAAPTLKDWPLVHEWIHPPERWKVLPDVVIVRSPAFDVTYRYYQDEEKQISYDMPVMYSVYERFKELFDELPWEEEE